MESLFQYVAPPTRCGYLPRQKWSLEYDYVASLTPAEYLRLLLDNWRRFGNMLFRPVCTSCRACRSLRVVVPRFRPDRSQKRCRKVNEGVVELRIGEPSVSRAKLNLYDRYHAFQADHKSWPHHAPHDASSYADSFVHHPFPVEEWCYYLDGRLLGVGYVDVLPGEKSEIRNPKSERNPKDQEEKPKSSEEGVSDFGFRISDLSNEGGLSAIYFFYDPRQRERSLGTWNVLCLLEEAARRRLPHVYLGYYVEGCGSMSYKTRFVPNQLRGEDGVWRDFRV
jgi:arginine-tRNA-protein transferase